MYSIKANKTFRLAIIDKDKCKPKKCHKECYKSCVVNQIGKLCIEIEEIAKISDELCIGCNICVSKCPFGAIKIVNLPSQIENALVHSYGENMFKLYKLPHPKLGKIIGILGPNGCGKTTIMNILSNNVKPNFGKDQDNIKIESTEVLYNVRGTELQKYLKSLYENKFRINVKPQDILSLINKIKNKEATIKDVLEKYKDCENYDLIIKTLDMNKIMNNKVLTLSGGELQKLTCSLSIIKEADVYFFDEPTNYLDIEYRIKIAKLIKEININNKYIYIVDHDLTVLDFVSDYIHIMYGEPSAYGVVSTLYSTLEGINIYFEGYIPADNMRFRKEPYKLNELYQNDTDEESHSNSVGTFKYDEDIVKFDNFELHIMESKIETYTNLIVVLGKNGTGKSTYLNYLRDKLNLQVSYKPQLNIINFQNQKITVLELFYEQIKESMTLGMFVSDVINLLNIDTIYNKKIKNLSGGEMQRVSIALCLGKKADVYLIDEPSASLDIEHRFNITKVIKRFLLHNKKIGFIVEHDILMAISLAKEPNSKIIMFEELENSNNNSKRICETSPLLNFNNGINKFLKSINTTFRTDKINRRPKINKLNSINDQEQKKSNNYYK